MEYIVCLFLALYCHVIIISVQRKGLEGNIGCQNNNGRGGGLCPLPQSEYWWGSYAPVHLSMIYYMRFLASYGSTVHRNIVYCKEVPI